MYVTQTKQKVNILIKRYDAHCASVVGYLLGPVVLSHTEELFDVVIGSRFGLVKQLLHYTMVSTDFNDPPNCEYLSPASTTASKYHVSTLIRRLVSQESSSVQNVGTKNVAQN